MLLDNKGISSIGPHIFFEFELKIQSKLIYIEIYPIRKRKKY